MRKVFNKALAGVTSALTVLVKLTPNASVAIKVADVTPANALLKTFLIFSIPPLNKT